MDLNRYRIRRFNSELFGWFVVDISPVKPYFAVATTGRIITTVVVE